MIAASHRTTAAIGAGQSHKLHKLCTNGLPAQARRRRRAQRRQMVPVGGKPVIARQRRHPPDQHRHGQLARRAGVSLRDQALPIGVKDRSRSPLPCLCRASAVPLPCLSPACALPEEMVM